MNIEIEMENGGIIKAELYPDVAPITVENFISLIERNFFDDLIFHRVIPGFMIQGGGFTADGQHKETDSIKGEFAVNGFENNLKHTEGVLSMARSMMPDSAGSQFFIMHKNAPHLDGQYAAFGKVTEGIDVAQAIVSSPRDWSDRPREDQVMTKVTVETFGVDYDEPVTGPERG